MTSFEDQTSFHVRSAVDGDQESLSWVIRRLSPLLMAQARHRLRNSMAGIFDPEDLVADVWAITLPKLANLTQREGRITPVLVSFLGTALVNRYNTLLQRHIARNHGVKSGGDTFEPADDTDVERLPAKSADVVRKSMLEEAGLAVQDALVGLSEEDRSIVMSRALEGASIQEIAMLSDMKPNTVSVRYKRAMDTLRQALPASVFHELD